MANYYLQTSTAQLSANDFGSQPPSLVCMQALSRGSHAMLLLLLLLLFRQAEGGVEWEQWGGWQGSIHAQTDTASPGLMLPTSPASIETRTDEPCLESRLQPQSVSVKVICVCACVCGGDHWHLWKAIKSFNSCTLIKAAAFLWGVTLYDTGVDWGCNSSRIKWNSHVFYLKLQCHYIYLQISSRWNKVSPLWQESRNNYTVLYILSIM